jgi:hypothetical protein
MALLVRSQLLHTATSARSSSRPRSAAPPPPTLRAPQRRRIVASSSAEAPQPIPQDPLKYDHLLVALVDSNPYLSSNSQSAVAASADLARAHNSTKITFLLIDEPGKSSNDSAGADPSLRIKNVNWHLRERGCETPMDFLERSIAEKGAASALVGDVADEVGADLLVMSSSGVHDRHVDANLLAEFVSCPVLLLP